MPDPIIAVSESELTIASLTVRSRDVAAYLTGVADADREKALVRAIEVGVFCLERAQSAKDVDFVRNQIDSLLATVATEVAKIPRQTEAALLAKIGVEDGQALAPVKRAVDAATTETGRRINDLRDLLATDLDPGKESSTLGKALQQVRNLLDPDRADSVQSALGNAVSKVVAEDGSLAKAVKSVVEDAVRPLADRVEKLTLEVRGQEAASEALAQTPVKGATYEDEVAASLHQWGKRMGLEVTQVGGDSRPGDVIMVATSGSGCGVALTLVVEVRDRQTAVGRKQVSETMETAMRERGASAGVYLSRTSDGLAKEIDDWAEGACACGPFIACTHDHMITAMRFMLAQKRLELLRQGSALLNTACVEAQIQRVRTALKRVATINSKLSGLRSSADDIRSEAEAIRDEIGGAMSEIEVALRAVPSGPPAASAADPPVEMAATLAS